MNRIHGFPPLDPEGARILILGSFPSEASLERGEYYGHGRNQFWALLGSILGFSAVAPYAERVAALASAGIALWDVIGSCERQGSLDQAIRSERANPIDEFLAARRGIAKLGLNGGKAFSSFAAFFAPELGRTGLAIGGRAEWRPPSEPARLVLVSRLPSTSPVPSRGYRAAQDKLPAWASFIA